MFRQDPELITESLQIKTFSKDCKRQSVKKVDRLPWCQCVRDIRQVSNVSPSLLTTRSIYLLRA